MCTFSQASEVAAQLNPCFVPYLAHVFEKPGTLNPHAKIVQTQAVYALPDRPLSYALLVSISSNCTSPNLSRHPVLAYTEHLHSGPSLFKIELKYMRRCGAWTSSD